MYTGTMIEDLIQRVELAEQRAYDGVRVSTDVSPEPLDGETYWQELIEVA
jgi:hypothetical protein